MKFMLLPAIIVIVSCATPTVVTKSLPAPNTEKAIPVPDVVIEDYTDITRQFFSTCETDIQNSSDIISKKKLITSLSHLNHMGSGGKRYYLLEKQAITKMLNELGSYSYSECYLIDSKGKIVYTMYNDDLLGKKVTSFKTSPLMPMYFEGVKDTSLIIDVTEFPVMSRSYDVYFSQPVKHENELHGILVTAIHIKNLTQKLPTSSKIISRKTGSFKFHSDSELFNTNDAVFSAAIKNTPVLPEKAVTYDDGAYFYQAVDYKSISWVLAIRKQYTTALNEKQ